MSALTALRVSNSLFIILIDFTILSLRCEQRGIQVGPLAASNINGSYARPITLLAIVIVVCASPFPAHCATRYLDARSLQCSVVSSLRYYSNGS